MEALKRFGVGIARPLIKDTVRGYVVRRLRKISPDDVIAAIETENYDVFSYMNDREWHILRVAAKKYRDFIPKITVKDVFEFVARNHYSPIVSSNCSRQR